MVVFVAGVTECHSGAPFLPNIANYFISKSVLDTVMQGPTAQLFDQFVVSVAGRGARWMYSGRQQ